MADYLTDAFIRLRQRLRRVSGKILPNADWTDDILQDSFVRLWRRQYPLQSEKEAEALLTRTVRNASLNERRRMRTEPLERDHADDSPDTQEKERAFARMKEKIETELTDTQRYILEEKEYGGRTIRSSMNSGASWVIFPSANRRGRLIQSVFPLCLPLPQA